MSVSIESVVDSVDRAPTREAALKAAADAVTETLLRAMKSSGVAKSEQAIDALKKSGMDLLLARSLGKGRVSYQMVATELELLRSALAARTMSALDIKTGIVAFDEAAQRLAIAGGKSGGFTYASQANRARDSLITFARSLHR